MVSLHVDRQVTLFEEFMLLKEFEKRENSFANKVNTKLSEKEEMQEKVREILSGNFRNVDCRAVDWHNILAILSLPDYRTSHFRLRVTQTLLEQTSYMSLTFSLSPNCYERFQLKLSLSLAQI